MSVKSLRFSIKSSRSEFKSSRFNSPSIRFADLQEGCLPTTGNDDCDDLSEKDYESVDVSAEYFLSVGGKLHFPKMLQIISKINSELPSSFLARISWIESFAREKKLIENSAEKLMKGQPPQK